MSSRKERGGPERVKGPARKAKSKPERKEAITMAQEDDKPKNPSDIHGSSSGRATGPRGGTTGAQPSGRVLSQGKQQFLISPRRMGLPGILSTQPLSFNFVEQTLRTSTDVEVVDVIGPRGLVGTLADGLAGQPNVII